MSSSEPSGESGPKSPVPGPKDLFLIEVARFLGVSPVSSKPLRESVVTEDWHLDELLDGIVASDGSLTLPFEKFNELMLHTRRPLVMRPFFDYFFSKATTVEEFAQSVERFRIEALWHFGSFKFALRRMASCTEQALVDLLERPSLDPPASDRDPFAEIESIKPDELWVLGYVSSDLILALRMAAALIERRLRGDTVEHVWSSVPPESVELLGRAFAQAGIDSGDVRGSLAAEAGDLQQLLAKISGEHQRLSDVTNGARAIGLRNTKRYLAMPYLDVYVATSMRSPSDFTEQAAFIKDVFQSPELSALHLRYFDPTLSFVDDRITKGLIECLMLRRAKVTIYNAGDKDSLGKDSELAATLAQGKPVIAYVPPTHDRRAKMFQADHPLGLQIAVQTGVAHGILVVRSAAQCARMLRRLLSHSLDLEVRHEGGNYQLVERETDSVLRVVSDDRLLTHSFWTFFHDKDLSS